MRISQEKNGLLNGMNSQQENAKRIIPQMQGVVEALLSRLLESISSMSKISQNMASDERNVDENNLQNRNSRCHQNLMEPETSIITACPIKLFKKCTQIEKHG